jgi:hypothetical protein
MAPLGEITAYAQTELRIARQCGQSPTRVQIVEMVPCCLRHPSRTITHTFEVLDEGHLRYVGAERGLDYRPHLTVLKGGRS